MTLTTPHWGSIIILVMFLSYTAYFNSHHTPVSAPALLPLLPVLLSLFGEDSSLQSVILPLQRDCRCLSAQRNCLPAANLKIKRVMRRDCPHPSTWQVWTVVRSYCWKWKPPNNCSELLETVTTARAPQPQAHTAQLCWDCGWLSCISTNFFVNSKF